MQYLSNDTIIHILKIFCKFSNKDCKNARLVFKKSRDDFIIFAELKSRFNKFVNHDPSTDTITLDIPNYVIPSDEHIKSQICSGLFDDKQNYDANTICINIKAPSGPNNKFKTMLQEKYPKTDFFMAYCPNPKFIKILNLNKWEIFNYPIINVSAEFPIINIYLLLALEDPIPMHGSHINMVRLIIDCDNKTISKTGTINTRYDDFSRDGLEYSLNKHIDIVEGIYFNEELPEKITVIVGNIDFKIKPIRKYIYLGMLRNDNQSIKFIIPRDIKFKIITWTISEKEQWNQISCKSIYYNQSNTHKTTITSDLFNTNIIYEPI